MTHPARQYTFLTNHTRVLRTIAQDPRARVRAIAAACQITERTVQAIIADLEQAGYLRRRRAGRRTQYVVDLDQPPRHPAEAELPVRALMELEADDSSQQPKNASASATVSQTRKH
ncbi:MarR family transcriptional regulator [Streptomyces sp. NPDC050732]|uniref:MarR family transcriptional regulator n=1 Tax=Streptomyces sp. NPDC050732 TaxID=3154632 RepID=UPI003441A055